MILGHILCYEDFQNATMCIGVEEVKEVEVEEAVTGLIDMDQFEVLKKKKLD